MGGRDRDEYDTSLDEAYLRYAAARLSAYSNVWWSMANEWNYVACKSRGINSTHLQSPSPVWDELFQTLSAADPYTRQMSIHNVRDAIFRNSGTQLWGLEYNVLLATIQEGMLTC